MVISNEDLCRIVAIVTSRLRKSGSGTSVLFGEGAPSNTPRPSSSNSIYIDSLTGNIYDWNPSTNSWDLMVSGASTEFGTSTEDPTDPPASGDPSVVLNTDNGQIWFWDGSDWVSYGDALEGKYVTISGDPQTITSEKTFNSVLNIGNNILPTNNNVYNIGASGNVFNTIWAENLAHNGALRLSASQGYYFSQNAAFNWNQVIGGFFNPGNEFFIQAPGPVPANNGRRLQVYSTSWLGGNVDVDGNIVPVTNITRSLGANNFNFLDLWVRSIKSNASIAIGAAVGSSISFFENNNVSGSGFVGGFYPTTKNFFLQAPGAIYTDRGERFQNYGTSYLGGNVNLAGDIIPTINNSYSLGSLNFITNAIWTKNIFSSTSVRIGTSVGNFLLFVNSNADVSNNFVGGFYPTTRNFFLQASGTANADLGHKFQLFGNQYVQGYTDVSVATATPSGTYSVPISPVVKLTLTSNPTLNFANHTTGLSTIIKLILIQDATGSRTITWGNVKFPGAIPPTLSSTANSRDVLTLLWDGEVWYLDNFIPDVR